ncbi:hypothetical protein RFI_14798 [Reticulomyxa filosa]|uniref:tyrosine--tRNA ligase n=1 Tax=Reticulomyxa filosa TaxID=46433 RepID=X6N8Q9_RETFI|nr:hypothetical protein RFI_14798 [Reticulomyxa filosa]|eukprot:ETO22401.1 hypothetical protein RFI_14798 [Reticulomyxa filosa]
MKQKRKKSNKAESGEKKEPGTLPNPTNELELSQRVRLCASVGEEVVQLDELEKLLKNKRTRPIAYDGFEPSGRMHIAQGILKAINVNKLTKSGVDFVFWVADWFALLNNKMDGDLNKIQTVGKYLIEVWKAAGMDMTHVYFKWCSDEINEHANEYWLRVMDISKHFNITRTKRCCTILGRTESDDMPTAHLMYACMQCADIFFLKADICQLGMDQRKVNMLAREYATKQKLRSPIVISHHMLMGLKEGQEKMSKSDPDSAIFMEDEAHDVNKKIKQAFCPPKEIANNPCLDYVKHIVFGKLEQFVVKRKPEHGGDLIYTSYEQLEKDYAEGNLHPGDLKPSLAEAINSFLEPVRSHFKNDKYAKQLLDQVKKYRVTK